MKMNRTYQIRFLTAVAEASEPARVSGTSERFPPEDIWTAEITNV
jgi:hypothetical protein